MLNEDIIIEAIHELSPKSTAGPDYVPSSLLVNCATELAPVLLLIFLSLYFLWSYPKILEESYHNSCFKTVPSNYRPIFLTSVICKVIERIIRNKYFPSLTKKSCLNSTQHVLSLIVPVYQLYWMFFVNIMHMLNSNPSVDMVYLYFSKAFDKVDHGILLHKLRAVGITRNIGIWLFHFLIDRSHFVQLPGGIIEDHPVVSCVPQGTVLGLSCS